MNKYLLPCVGVAVFAVVAAHFASQQIETLQGAPSPAAETAAPAQLEPAPPSPPQDFSAPDDDEPELDGGDDFTPDDSFDDSGLSPQGDGPPPEIGADGEVRDLPQNVIYAPE